MSENRYFEQDLIRTEPTAAAAESIKDFQRFKTKQYSYDDIVKITGFLKEKTLHRPTIGIICGSGLGGLANLLENQDTFPYRDIPNFPVSTVPGHAGRLVFGSVGDKTCMCMQGRFHMYEGYPSAVVAMPVRVMKMMGVEVIIVTNAAGGLNQDYNVGDIMLIKDHIFLPGFSIGNPLVGYNDDRLGPRFPDISAAYDSELRRLALTVSKQLGMESFTREGVISVLGGPSYETVAECRALRSLGADVTGMSIAPEVILARHCGLRVFAMSLVTNKCIMDYDTNQKTNHEEVLETGRMRGELLEKMMVRFIEEI